MDQPPPPSLAEDALHDASRRLRDARGEAMQAFASMQSGHAYTSPRLLRSLLDSKLPELWYPTPVRESHTSHTLVSIPRQTCRSDDSSFLSVLCADCRYHFHVKTYEAGSRPVDSARHPTHMLLPMRENPLADPSEKTLPYYDVVADASYVCAEDDCSYAVSISVTPPKLTDDQIMNLGDDARIARNLAQARTQDPQRYLDAPDRWAAGSTITTLIQYLEDRLTRPSDVLKIKTRNKKFCVAFGTDFDDLLRSLGFEQRTDEDGEECWYITEPEPDTSSTKPFTRRAFLQDTQAELKIYTPATTNPAWEDLLAALCGKMQFSNSYLESGSGISEDDLSLLGCLGFFSPHWFSWVAILLANLCPRRRDEFLDAGLRCIQDRNEEAALSIVVYKSKFDQNPLVNPQVQAAFDFFGEDCKDVKSATEKYHAIVDRNPDPAIQAQAYQHLEAIKSQSDVELFGDMSHENAPALPSANGKRRMSVGAATRLLNVETNFTAEIIRDFAVNVSEVIDRGLVLDALKALSDFKREQGNPSEAESLDETAEFIRATGDAEAYQADIPSAQPAQTSDHVARLTAPPGLRNIGNTCYLNSLLQYFYNVKPIRELVLNYEQYQLGLEDSSVNGRLTGGNGTPVSLEEAIVARQFIEELRRLFLELEVTVEAAASPSQKLANTALSSAKEILTAQRQPHPPPLPARPSPMPPIPAGEAGGAVSVTVEPVEEHNDAASSSGSQTLVHEPDDLPAQDIAQGGDSSLAGELSKQPRMEVIESIEHVEDVTMDEGAPPQTLDAKIAHISQRLERSDRSGTSQQDVEEIIGNILEHLMRAIRPDGPMDGKPNLQADQITRLFFTTIVNSTVRTVAEQSTEGGASRMGEDVLNEEVVPERWITAFPHPDKEHATKSDLYQALDRYFSYELLSEGALARYTTIHALPPIVHICIQRTDASGVKNKNPVIIPEELYLDRYMEAAADSDLGKTRRRIWAIKERIKDLESRAFDKLQNGAGSQSWNASGQADAEQSNSLARELSKFDSELFRDIARPTKPSFDIRELSSGKVHSTEDTSAVRLMDTLVLLGQDADKADSVELEGLRKEEGEAFKDLRQYKYCLHAMICHGGGMNAGHYWVWIRDFKKQVWYKYNDNIVTEDTRDSQHVIDELNNSGDPYYVAYVSEDAKEDLVEVPQRAHARAADDVEMVNAPDSSTLEVIDSIVIDSPAQPANSPVNPPVQDVTMAEVPAEPQLSDHLN
ncbi:cysteine proteinase [Xylariaceae sp. FL0594]|nr:cysteine proteinase [Xylariaceae sp. FL0594]